MALTISRLWLSLYPLNVVELWRSCAILTSWGCQSWPMEHYETHRNSTRNLLSSTTPFGGLKDSPSLDIARAISGRRPFYKSCQSWPIGHYETHRNFTRNLLSSTTPLGGLKDGPSLDIVRAISWRRPFYESCQIWPIGYYGTPRNLIRNLLSSKTPFGGLDQPD